MYHCVFICYHFWHRKKETNATATILKLNYLLNLITKKKKNEIIIIIILTTTTTTKPTSKCTRNDVKSLIAVIIFKSLYLVSLLRRNEE